MLHRPCDACLDHGRDQAGGVHLPGQRAVGRLHANAPPTRRSFVWLLWFYLESLIHSGQKELERLKRYSYVQDA